MTLPDDPAFAFAWQSNNDATELGLTKREYFAALAMQGNLAACSASYPDTEALAKKSVEYADAVIAQLNKETNKKTS